MFHNISEAASYEAPGPNGGVRPFGEGNTRNRFDLFVGAW